MNHRSKVDVKGEVRGGRPVDLPECRLAVCYSKWHLVDITRRDARVANEDTHGTSLIGWSAPCC